MLHRRIRRAAEGMTFVLVVAVALVSWLDRRSTRLNSSHVRISYAVFCLKKKKIPSKVDKSCNHRCCVGIHSQQPGTERIRRSALLIFKAWKTTRLPTLLVPSSYSGYCFK